MSMVLLLTFGFERRDELGQVLAGDPAQFTDLDTPELAGPQQ
jgi:hypothetical protein